MSTSYDAIGNVASSTDPLGNVTRYVYDAARELTGTVSPDPDGSGPLKNRAVVASYTPHGLVASVAVGTANADGSGFTSLQQANTSYDAADRRTQASVTAGGTVYAVTQYSYDVANRTMCAAVRMTLVSLPADACAAGAPGSGGPDRIGKVQYDALGRTSSTITALGTSAQDRWTFPSATNSGQVTRRTMSNTAMTRTGTARACGVATVGCGGMRTTR